MFQLRNHIQSGGFYWMSDLMDSSCYLVEQVSGTKLCIWLL